MCSNYKNSVNLYPLSLEPFLMEKLLAEDLESYAATMCSEDSSARRKLCSYSRHNEPQVVPLTFCEELLLWTESPAIKPPPEFQDPSPNSSSPQSSPSSPQVTPIKFPRSHVPSLATTRSSPARLRPDVPEWLEKIAIKMVTQVLEEALMISGKLSWSIHCSEECHPRRDSDDKHRKLLSVPDQLQCQGPRLCWTPELPYTMCRPSSRSSLSSRLSSSHNSLSVPAANRVDDSSFITSAMSHEVLSTGDISDMYNVPVDCDVYAVPVDMVRPPQPLPPQRPKRQRQFKRKRKQSNSEVDCSKGRTLSSHGVSRPHVLLAEQTSGRRRLSRPGRSASMECTTQGEPIHMTLAEVRRYLSNLYSSSSDSSEYRRKLSSSFQTQLHSHVVKSKKLDGQITIENLDDDSVSTFNGSGNKTHRKNTFAINVKNKKSKESGNVVVLGGPIGSGCMLLPETKPKRGLSFSSTLKQTFCNIFRFRRMVSSEHSTGHLEHGNKDKPGEPGCRIDSASSPLLRPRFSTRALPPLPARDGGELKPSEQIDSDDVCDETCEVISDSQEHSVDFASSIEKVKDYGWYWGPISGEAAEKILSSEPDGSFIVRDSSDDHYIFSLTFKLNSCVRHVRIEQDQGNFSFGSCTKFKSHTIVDFIENAVEHSRSGRYLFFLHRRPVLGPMRVQLLHPVSRFKQVQSLQHMCRFVILKVVRRDLISTLPLPRRLVDYLNTPHYYSEQLAEETQSAAPSSPSLVEQGIVSFIPLELTQTY